MAILHGWRWCPRCRTELEREPGAARCPSCGFAAYANSAPTASALVEDGRGRLLLARRSVEPDAGRWDVPGGYLEEGEHPLDGLRRELREEAGLAIEPLELLGIWMGRYGDEPDAPATLNLYWRARRRRRAGPGRRRLRAALVRPGGAADAGRARLRAHAGGARRLEGAARVGRSQRGDAGSGTGERGRSLRRRRGRASARSRPSAARR